MIEHVHKLIERAASENHALNAMQLSQAALNAANALSVIDNIPQAPAHPHPDENTFANPELAG